MKLNTHKILTNTLSSKELDIFNALDKVKYGEALALKVTDKLTSNEGISKGLYNSHRDYCGLGLFNIEEKFTLSVVYDGYGADTHIAEFESKSDFVLWLANESDQSMSLYGKKFNNQTITKVRLMWFLEDNYSPIWNDYCMYVREMP